LDGPGGAKEAGHRPEAIHLMKQPGVEPVTVTIGPIPVEHASGELFGAESQ